MLSIVVQLSSTKSFSTKIRMIRVILMKNVYQLTLCIWTNKTGNVEVA
uniref:Uncharacterized protein n=1 Tax=Arundo donax TaxID=35708 RepID=A0A0A9CU30_ARUDO